MAVVFETSDLDVAHRFLAGSYGPLRLRAAGAAPIRIVQQHLGPVRLHRVTSPASLEVHGGPLDTFTVARVAGGEVICGSAHPDHQYRAGAVFLAGQPGQTCHAVLHAPDLELAFLDPGLVARAAGRPAGRSRRALRLTGSHPVSPDAAARWRTTYDYVRDAESVPSVVAGDPLLATSLARLLAAMALSVFQHDGGPSPDTWDSRDPRPVSLRHAIGFIDANAHHDIDLADIAAAAHVTVRALQLTFRRHLGTTPMAHLRRLRLDRAHRDLLIADPAMRSIGKVAARWGFSNHSRFAAMYRDAYGCAPSATLGAR